MANEAGDGLSLNEDRPAIDDPHGNDYSELRHIKKGMRIRLEKEHNCDAATMATNGAGGEHLNGSAVAYEGAATPSSRPDGSTALANNAYDRGRLWLDDNYDPPVLKRWDGTAWEVLGRMLVDDESLVVSLVNEKQENIDGGRETRLVFKGKKTDGTSHELATIQVSHDGTGDDYKGDIILYVNDGNDAAGSLTEVLRIDSAKLATFAGNINVANAVAIDGGTAVLSLSDTDEAGYAGQFRVIAEGDAMKFQYKDLASGAWEPTFHVSRSGDDCELKLWQKLDANNKKIINLDSGTSNNDAVNKGQLDAAVTNILISQLEAGGAKFKVGSYTGNGASGRSITGVGFQPSIVLLYDTAPGSAMAMLIKTNLDTGGGSKWVTGGYETTGITSLDADGFTLGTNVDYVNNSDGRKYIYIAVKVNT